MFKEWLPTLACGLFGGLAPGLLDLAGRFKYDDPPGSGYYVAALIFAFIGGATALIYKEKVTHKAFLLGVGAPALIVAGASTLDSHDLNRASHLQRPQPAVEVAANASPLAWLTTAAYAQSPESKVDLPRAQAASEAASRQLRIDLVTPTPGSPYSIEFFGPQEPDAAKSEPVAEFGGRKSNLDLRVPTTAVRIRIDGRNYQTDTLQLPANAEHLQISIEHQNTFMSGLFSALGMPNRADEAKRVTVVLAEKAPA